MGLDLRLLPCESWDDRNRNARLWGFSHSILELGGVGEDAWNAFEKTVKPHLMTLPAEPILVPDYLTQREGRVAGTTHWHPLRPYTSVIRLPKDLFNKPLTLENTIAHEMVHHRNNLAMTDGEIEKYLETEKPPEWWDENNGHGKAFREGADRINAIMGPDYVTEEGTTEAEEEEWKRVSKVERTRRKKIRFGTKLVVALGGGYLAAVVLSKLFPRGHSPSPESGPRSSVSSTAPAAPPRLPRGSSGASSGARQIPPTSRASQSNANERGSYGRSQTPRFTSSNERGSYGRPPTRKI